MLRTRIITAAVLAPLALLGIFNLSPDHFALGTAALLLVGSWEFRKLTGDFLTLSSSKKTSATC